MGSSASKIKWGECESQQIYDVATGKNDPDPPVVGQSVDMNLDIIFNEEADIQGV